MKMLITRVHRAAVKAAGDRNASINRGLAVFIGIERSDHEEAAATMVSRVTAMRIFENEQGKLHCSVKDKGYEILCIPNFTLCARTDRGRRPSFDDAMEPQAAQRLFEYCAQLFSSQGIKVQLGAFGEHMDIELSLDGPVNIAIESKR